MSFPMLIENTEATGELYGRPLSVSTLATTSLLLTSRGVDKILVATPAESDRLIVERGLLSLPPERRANVALVVLNVAQEPLAEPSEFGEAVLRQAHFVADLPDAVADSSHYAFLG